MTKAAAVWGIHMGEHVGARPVEQGYVAIGWSALGDLRQYPDREALKAALEQHYPYKKAGSRPVDAGILFRFTNEMKPGDYADQRISIDLDDGVKGNFGKFGSLLADRKAVTSKKG